MFITDIIQDLQTTNREGLTLRNGADDVLINKCESTYGIVLPDDFKAFYRFSDGFETVEDMFNLIPLEEIIETKNRNKEDALYIAEYMLYCDMWQLEINPDDCNDYKIIIEANNNKLVLTNSLAEFISRFLKGGVFEDEGLYEWRDEVEKQSIYSTKLKTAESLLTFFYYCLRYGLISKQEVVEWADTIVMHEDEPESFFIELSLSRDKNELITLLNSVYVPKNSVVARAILGLLYNRLSTGAITVDEAIAIMDKHSFSDLLTRLETAHIYNFTDEIWLDDSQIEDNELTQKVLNFLAYYKEFEIENFKYWFCFSSSIEYRLKTDEEKSNPEYPGQENKFKIKLWMIDALVYALALISFIVIIIPYVMIDDKMPSSKFSGDVYRLSRGYFFVFICYYIWKSGQWLVKKLVARFKKVVS